MIIINAQENEIEQPEAPQPPMPSDNDIPLEDNDEPLTDDIAESIQPVGELPERDFEPYDIGTDFEVVGPPPSKWDEENAKQGRQFIPEKVWLATSENVPLRIIYTTLQGHTTERTVHPDHVHYAKGHAILVAWCDLRNDWRAFIIDRISQAKLEG